MFVSDDLKHFLAMKVDHLFSNANIVFSNPKDNTQIVKLIFADLMTLGFDSFCKTRYNTQNLVLLSTALEYISTTQTFLPKTDSTILINLFLKNKPDWKNIKHMRLFLAATKKPYKNISAQIGRDYFQVLNALIKADKKINSSETKLLMKYNNMFSEKPGKLSRIEADGYDFIDEFLDFHFSQENHFDSNQADSSGYNSSSQTPDKGSKINKKIFESKDLDNKFEEIIQKINKFPIEIDKLVLEKSLLKLKKLIGLNQIKKEVLEIINLLLVNKLRKSKSIKTLGPSLHLVFTGNPGTGKTTIARLLTEIFYALGILEYDKMIENAVKRRLKPAEEFNHGTSFDHMLDDFVTFPDADAIKSNDTTRIKSISYYKNKIRSGLHPIHYMIEIDKSGLIAPYLGQTSLKTKMVCMAALGGVLFIDEAYALSSDTSISNNQYGDEAIATLMKFMEDNRDGIIVIVAGYPKPMDSFLKSNPGLKSRFNKYLNFDDYSSKELVEIFGIFAKEYQFNIDAQANKRLAQVFDAFILKKDEFFGNARLARNIFEKAYQAQASRIITETNISEELLLTITLEDIETALKK